MSTVEPITPERAIQQAAETHKYSHGYDPEVLIRNVHFDPQTEGGLVCIRGIFASIRGPKWRNIEGDHTVRTSDLMLVPGLTDANSINPDVARIGHEVEGYAVRLTHPRSNNTQRIMGVESVDVSDEDDLHPELFSACKEMATVPQSNNYLAGEQLTKAIHDLNNAMQAKGASLYPGANLAYRFLTMDDLNPDPYVQRIVRLLSGLQGYTWLDRASVQQHIERSGTLADSAFAFNILSHYVAPAMSALSAASPYARGELTPAYPTHEDIPHELGYMATGYFGRTASSPEAGPALFIAPTNIREMRDHIDQRLRSEIPTAGRAMGHHTDRLRMDIGPLGTIELCADDNFGLHIETIMAASLVKRAVTYTLETTHRTGDISHLAKQYPLVVRSTISEVDAAISHTNSALINQFGLAAPITAANGETVSAQTVVEQILNMAKNETKNTPYGLPSQALKLLTKRMRQPNAHDLRKDPSGLITAATYYNGGSGTLSHYLRARVEQLVQLKFTPQEAIGNAMADATRAFGAYLRKFNPERHLAFLDSEE